MKIIKQLLIGAIVGFIIAISALNFSTIDFSHYAKPAVICLFSLNVILLGWSLLLCKQIKQLHNTELTGEEEDAAGELKYKKFSDYSLFAQSSTVLSFLALSFTLVCKMDIVLVILAIILLIVGYAFTAYMIQLMKFVYPDREIPPLSDTQFSEKLLEISDEGEKHIIMHGLYKSYNLLSIALTVAIAAAVIYSMLSQNSQLFSIIAMCIVLLLVHGKYILTIRDK